LVQHHAPVLYKLISKVLYLFAKPRETPLADGFVLKNAARSDDAAPFTLVSRLGSKSKEMNASLDAEDIACECLDHMAAGIDTTGDALCFLMWELSQPRSLGYQQKLQEELASTSPDISVEKLPYLDAVVMEGLRCFPPIPMSLPRRVPAGGKVIDGYVLPAGTVVSCQAISVHMINADVFPEPEKFDPSRWLSAEGDIERKRLMFAFASGGRACIGKQYVSEGRCKGLGKTNNAQ
jgi:cytochrome P450